MIRISLFRVVCWEVDIFFQLVLCEARYLPPFLLFPTHIKEANYYIFFLLGSEKNNREQISFPLSLFHVFSKQMLVRYNIFWHPFSPPPIVECTMCLCSAILQSSKNYHSVPLLIVSLYNPTLTLYGFWVGKSNS